MFVVAVGGFGLVRVVPVRKNSFVLRETVGMWGCAFVCGGGVVLMEVVGGW